MIFYAIQRGEEDASLNEAEIWLQKAVLLVTNLLMELWAQN